MLVTAAAITLSALVVIVGASPRIARVAQSEMPAPVRILDATAAASCDQQTWPYIEPRCRKPGDALKPQPSPAPYSQSTSAQADDGRVTASGIPVSTSIAAQDRIPEPQGQPKNPTGGSALDASRPAVPDAKPLAASAPLQRTRDDESQAGLSSDSHGLARGLEYRHHRRHVSRRFRHIFGFDH
jgi:hypothetical protein